tara:strand:+ start:115 stop:660 length:546 start_codon:yes stop_codon:yes gene_type:complete
MGWFSDSMFGKRKQLDLQKIRGYLQPTQSLIDYQGRLSGEQIGIGRDLMDPTSHMNQMMRNMILQQNQNTGAQVGQSIAKLGAQEGASSAQSMMQQRMAMQDAMASSNNQSMQMLQNRFSQGTGLLGQGVVNAQRQGQQQLALDENIANAYIGQINAENAARQANQNTGMDMIGGLLGAFL